MPKDKLTTNDIINLTVALNYCIAQASISNIDVLCVGDSDKSLQLLKELRNKLQTSDDE